MYSRHWCCWELLVSTFAVDFQWTVQGHVPENTTLQARMYSYKMMLEHSYISVGTSCSIWMHSSQAKIVDVVVSWIYWIAIQYISTMYEHMVGTRYELVQQVFDAARHVNNIAVLQTVMCSLMYWTRLCKLYMYNATNLELCKIWGFHSDDYEESRFLGCCAMWILCERMLRRNTSPLPLG
jgi:hypothetical protein